MLPAEPSHLTSFAFGWTRGSECYSGALAMLLQCPWVGSSLLGNITVSLLGQTLGEVRKKGPELGFPLIQANVLVLFPSHVPCVEKCPSPRPCRGELCLDRIQAPAPAAWASHKHFMVLTLCEKVYFAFFLFFLKVTTYPT